MRLMQQLSDMGMKDSFKLLLITAIYSTIATNTVSININSWKQTMGNHSVAIDLSIEKSAANYRSIERQY